VNINEFSPYNDSALERLSEGDTVLIYDPKKNPEIFEAFFVSVSYDKRKEKVIGAITRSSYVQRTATVWWTPLYRIGYPAYMDRENMPLLDDYES
jgi:hypothetical protein